MTPSSDPGRPRQTGRLGSNSRLGGSGGRSPPLDEARLVPGCSSDLRKHSHPRTAQSDTGLPALVRQRACVFTQRQLQLFLDACRSHARSCHSRVCRCHHFRFATSPRTSTRHSRFAPASSSAAWRSKRLRICAGDYPGTLPAASSSRRSGAGWWRLAPEPPSSISRSWFERIENDDPATAGSRRFGRRACRPGRPAYRAASRSARPRFHRPRSHDPVGRMRRRSASASRNPCCASSSHQASGALT